MTYEAPRIAPRNWRTEQDLGAYLAGLRPSARNVTSAALAVARIDELGWAPLGGYPGSDVLWPVACLMCGWSGTRFYSHLRRARPAMRHRGCLPQSEHPSLLSALSAYAADTCRCRRGHPTTVHEVADVLVALQRAVREDDHGQVVAHVRALTGPCPATAARAQAVRALHKPPK
ncbi:hypothetical protein [Streptomyces alanosinicus]|uniref:Uncharacterized protein n=1 Tax=Streptomyces alanosinicus TaxID=68171 RepID=A0A919D4A3_9ACTN|nr:hypothetical protein [Streptomyces alanosinicus]GHE09211.1 hypothetical protein GCM10010339_60710 [Streptomyces alanosinicus]